MVKVVDPVTALFYVEQSSRCGSEPSVAEAVSYKCAMHSQQCKLGANGPVRAPGLK